jgi:hypothetical protein
MVRILPFGWLRGGIAGRAWVTDRRFFFRESRRSALLLRRSLLDIPLAEINAVGEGSTLDRILLSTRLLLHLKDGRTLRFNPQTGAEGRTRLVELIRTRAGLPPGA